jgi:hypothetical protein
MMRLLAVFGNGILSAFSKFAAEIFLTVRCWMSTFFHQVLLTFPAAAALHLHR